MEHYPIKENNPETRVYEVRGLGGAAAVTQEEGDGVALTYVSTGIYRLTWTENPGVFLSGRADLGAATPDDLKGHGVIRDTLTAWDGSTAVLDFHVFNDTPALHDLAANEYIDIQVKFKETSV